MSTTASLRAMGSRPLGGGTQGVLALRELGTASKPLAVVAMTRGSILAPAFVWRVIELVEREQALIPRYVLLFSIPEEAERKAYAPIVNWETLTMDMENPYRVNWSNIQFATRIARSNW